VDSGDDPFDDPVIVPIVESIDLHHFHPKEVLVVVDAYIDAAREAGFREVRIIHGRGKGVQRARVRQLLEADSRVEHFFEAAADRGGWGATIACLKPLGAVPESEAAAEAQSVPRVFVGDVQGCAAEFDEILARAQRELGADFELWCVGDLLNRGPESRRALERVRELREAGRARVVLGNHEIGFFMKALGLRSVGPSDTLDDLLAGADRDEWIEWLRQLPLVEVGQLADPGREPFAMVHAAVHPHWDLETLQARASSAETRLRAGSLDDLARFLGGNPAERDGAGDTDAGQAADRLALDCLTRCRSVLLDVPGGSREAVHCSDETPEDARARSGRNYVPWHEAWAAQGYEYGIVYGHWALQGLHVSRRLRGLDTGCVHHGRDRDGFLTAWVPDACAGFTAADDRLWQVRAKRRYYRDA
jgi:bis(5'-nucleosyl)-tetraphosphatase (symmetrical)